MAISDEQEDAFRTLGIAPEASYDEIMDSYMDLQERYDGDASMLAKIEESKETVINLRLQQRMSGAKAQYEGQLSREDVKAPPKTPPWVILNDYRKMLILPPSPKYALKVIGLMGGLTLATWIAPTTAGTICLINVVSGMGFIYNRGEVEVVRDDFGQIGEIRPMKPKPFMLTSGITLVAWIAGWWKAKQIVAAMAAAPRGLELVLRTTLISAYLMIPALFVKVHTIFDY